MSSLAPGPVNCPSCNREVALHPWFVRKRVRELSCTQCGAQIEVSIPVWPHYLTAFGLALLGEIVAFVLLFLILLRNGWGVALVIAVFTSIELARSMWLRSRSTVRWINERSMQRRSSGAWVPE